MKESLKKLFFKIISLTLALSMLGCDSNQNSTKNYKSNYRSVVDKLSNKGSWLEAIEIAKIELQNLNLSKDDELFYLLALAENYRFSEHYKLSEQYFKKVINHPASNEFPKYTGEAYYGLGDLFYLKWNYFKEEEAINQAIVYLDSSMNIAIRSNNLKLKSKNLYRSGTILQIQGNVDSSSINFIKGIEISTSINDTAGIIRNDIHKAADLEEQGSLDSALFYYNRAYEFGRIINRNYSEAHSLINLGSYYFDRGKLEIANDFFNKAKFLSEELNHGIVLCRSYYNFCRLNSILNKKDLSREYYEKGIAIAKGKGYKNYEKYFMELGKELEINLE